MAETTTKATDPSSKEQIQHLQQLVRELVITETTTSSGGPGQDATENFDQISYTIKQIFQTGKEEAFADQLSTFIHRKEMEIEKMCNFHYQEFVQSVDQLLKVRVGTVTLRNKIVDLNQELQETGGNIVEKKKEMIENRRTLLNIETAMDALQSCLFVLDIANKVNTHIENRKYYSALRLLEELQNVHLRHIIKYSFAKHMHECIPFMQDKVRICVLQEVKEWFVRIRENTRRIGRMALDHTAKKQEKLRARLIRQEKGMPVSASSVNLGTSFEMVMNEEDANDALNNDEIKVDFRPLHQCLHIHDVLGKRGEFTANYEENRKLQAALVLAARFSFKDGDLTGFQTYLHDVVGFFIIEAVVLNSTENFRSRTGVELLWENATDKMTQVITESLQDCGDPDLFLSIKLLVIAFIHTMEGYGYEVRQLMDLMLSLLDRYAELMKLQCSERVVEIIEDDEYAPMVVHNEEEFETVLKAFNYKDDSKLKPLRYPRSLPFSPGFVQSSLLIKSFIQNFYRFAEGFAQQYNEMDDLLKKSLENLLVQNLNGAILRKLAANNLSQVVQIIVNLEYFQLVCGEFEELLVENRYSHKGGRVVLEATQNFADSRLLAEKRIFDLVNQKTDEFLELAEYDWSATTSQTKPSPYLQDLINFLTTIINSTLANLPSSMKSYIYFNAFDHLASSLNGILLRPDVKRITTPFLDTFEIDLAYLEKFASGLGDVSVGDAFAELRQTIAFLKSDNYEEYGNQQTRSKKYPRLRIQNAINLLEKLKGDTSVFSKTTPAEKEKRKKIETTVKTLRSQQGKDTSVAGSPSRGSQGW